MRTAGFGQRESNDRVVRSLTRLTTALAIFCAIGCDTSTSVQEAGHPGKWRWDVKTLTDADADRVNFTAPIRLTIAEAAGFSPPAEQELGVRTPRGVRPEELNLYEIEAEAVAYKFEPDGDYHLLVADSQGTTRLGVEIVNPGFASASAQIAAIRSTRQNFDKWVGGKPRTETGYTRIEHVPVRITGVGFWDDPHGQRGLASGFELHPVLSIDFK